MPAQGEIRDRDGTGDGYGGALGRVGLSLIETLRWEPGTGFVRGDRHLARLAASAQVLGLPCRPDEVFEAMAAAVGGTAPLRVRLELQPDGRPGVTTQPFVPFAPDAVWTLAIAATRLASADPLLRHKTNHRQAYDAARAEFSRQAADEVILLNERGEVCEGTITNIFLDRRDGGPLLTPSIACGLLAGVLRGEMIERGEAVEAMLTAEDLAQANAIFVGNSLRGLIRARLGRA